MTASKHERDELANGGRRESLSWQPVENGASWPDVDPDSRNSDPLNPSGKHRAEPRNNGQAGQGGQNGYPGWAPVSERTVQPRPPQHRSGDQALTEPPSVGTEAEEPSNSAGATTIDPNIVDRTAADGTAAGETPAADATTADRTTVDRPVGKGRPVAQLSPSERYVDTRPPSERAAARRAAAKTTVMAAVNGEPATTVTKPADEEASSEPPKKPNKPAKKGSFWKELPILIGIALVLTFLIQTFVARVYVIPSGSMEQTLNGCTGCVGDRILVDKITYDFGSPQPGDVVVFKGPAGWDQNEFTAAGSSNPVVQWLREFGSSIGIGSPPEYDLVKRVIAVGGQTISCCDPQNRVIVDGKPLNEPYVYLYNGQPQMNFAPITIPKGFLWVMGDNRNNSDDSRLQNGAQTDPIRGIVPASNVIGIARTIIWPPSRWRGIGEINPHTATVASAPAWTEGLPAGVGFAAAWPTLWMGRRLRRRIRGAAARGAASARVTARRRRR